MSLSLLSPLFPYTTLFRSPFPCPLVGLVCAAAHGLESGGHPVERFPRGGGGEASAWAARLPRSGVLALSGAVLLASLAELHSLLVEPLLQRGVALPLLAEHGHEEAAVDQHVLLVGVEGARHPQHLAGRERGGHGVLRGVTAGDRHVVVVLDLGVHDQRPLLMTDFVLQHDEPVLLLRGVHVDHESILFSSSICSPALISP